MKKLLLICLFLSGIALQAQPGNDVEEAREARKEMRDQMKDLTPTQRAELKTKRMALHLNLTDAQQKAVQKLLLEREESLDKLRSEKENAKEASKDERYERKRNRLDEQIAMKREMKSILTEAQFAKYEKMMEKRHLKRGHFKKGRKR